jgi:hypothetical protein
MPSAANTVHIRNSIDAGPGIGNFDQLSTAAINTTAAGAPSFFGAVQRLGGTAPDALCRPHHHRDGLLHRPGYRLCDFRGGWLTAGCQFGVVPPL